MPPDAARSFGTWRETLWVVAVGATVLGLSSAPAFHTYFFGEAFLYLGQYWASGRDFWHALLSPSGIMFFKPVCFAASLPWYDLFGDHVAAYHWRNFLLSVVVLVLLHRVLLHLVPSRWARALAVLLFAASKVHFTTIGYMMIFDSILMSTLILASALFTLRWCAEGKSRDQILAVLAVALASFTKDYGVAVVVVIVAILAVRPAWRTLRLRDWGWWLGPLASIAVAKLIARHVVVGSMPWLDPIYAPRFSLSELPAKLLMLLSAATNLTVARHDKTGASGLGTVVAHLFTSVTGRTLPTIGRLAGAEMVDALAALGLLGLVVVTQRHTALRRRDLVIPALWILAFLTPTLLIRNHQIYYALEPLLGVAILFGVWVASTTPRIRMAWTAAIALIAMAGAASNRAALYDWQFAARSARHIRQPVLATYRSTPLDWIVFVTSDPVFWRWVLTADDQAPMIQALLDQPRLRVGVVAREDAHRLKAGTDTYVVLDADAGFRRLRSDEAPP